MILRIGRINIPSFVMSLEDAGILKDRKIIEQVFVANVGGGIINHQTGIASSLVSRIDLEPAMAELVENGLRASGRLLVDDPQIGMELDGKVGIVKEVVGEDKYGFMFDLPY